MESNIDKIGMENKEIASFLYNSLPPDEKLKALESENFPLTMTKEQKKATKSVLEAQIAKNNFIEQAQTTAQVVAGVGTILNNIG